MGLIIGLGAVTVIDIHGFLGRKSSYWTLATTRAHKVTKPLIWVGTLLSVFGGTWFYYQTGVKVPLFEHLPLYIIHLIIFGVLILNGLFLTFGVSRFLLKREVVGKSEQLLPAIWQRRITASFLLSFAGWWGSVALFVYVLNTLII
jgi:hypothetical protein